jgi:hypothetical protein
LKFTWASLDGPADPLQAAIAVAKARAGTVRRAVLRIGKAPEWVVGASIDQPYGNRYADGDEFRKSLSANNMQHSPQPRKGPAM